MSQQIAARLAGVQARIEAAAGRVGRDPAEITLVGVSKRQPAERVAEGARAGIRHMGENYVQEAQTKLPEVHGRLEPDQIPRWHFIGQLQRNKARHVVRLFDVVETVDRVSLGEELDRRADGAARRLEILLQVNVSEETQKGGVAPAELPALLEASRTWTHLDVRGLMTVPAASDDPQHTRGAFAQLRELRDAHRAAPGGEALQALSMGMSGDFEVAIEEGATIIRVGTALFGARE
jgi:pyridoxal phosphate enzyme (YggS family)